MIDLASYGITSQSFEFLCTLAPNATDIAPGLALSWSPDFRDRRTKADALFEGRLVGERALDFVRSTRARFLYADCRELADLSALLRPELERVDRYGCATVYVLRERPYMAQAAGPPHDGRTPGTRKDGLLVGAARQPGDRRTTRPAAQPDDARPPRVTG